MNLPYTRNKNTNPKKIGKRCWNNNTTNVVDAASTASQNCLSRCRSESPTVLAVNTLTSSLATTDAAPSSSTIPSLHMSACEVCYDSAYFTLCSWLLLREVPANIPSIFKAHIKRKNNSNHQQQPFNAKSHFSSSCSFKNNPQSASVFGCHTRVSQYAYSVPPSKKLFMKRTRAKLLLSIFLVHHTDV